MRLLLFTYEFPPWVGGIGRYCYELAKGLHGLGQDVVVLTFRYSENNNRYLDDKGAFKIIRIPKTRFSKLDILIGCIYLSYFVFIYKPNYLLVTHEKSELICSILALFSPLKFSIIIIGSDILYGSKGMVKRWLFDKIYHKSTRIISISEFTKELLLSNFNVSPKKVSVVHCGINIKNFTVPKEEITSLKERFGSSNEKIILTLARLIPRKGQDVVIEALPTVIEKIPNIRYIIVGDGPDKERLRELVDRYNLNSHVIFAGPVPDDKIIGYYDMCDIFVMPSREEREKVEGLGISFLEAGARGKPVIGGRHGGVPEVIVDGETGLLIDPTNVEELAQAIIKLLQDDRLAKEMGRKGKERVFRYFTSEIMSKKTLEALGYQRESNVW
jgi:phosphatidylinositol alpha-1,6-mannosyltransferase